MKDGELLHYPLNFYIQKKLLFREFLAASFFLFLVLFALFSNVKLNYFMRFAVAITAIMSICMFYFAVYDVLSKKPNLILTEDELYYRRGFLRFSQAWSDINLLALDDVLHSSYLFWGSGSIIYKVTLILKSGESSKTFQLFESKLNRGSHGMPMNEKEIFHLIEQSLHKQPITYKNIAMSFSDHKKITIIDIVIWSFFIIAFIIVIIVSRFS